MSAQEPDPRIRKYEEWQAREAKKSHRRRTSNTGSDQGWTATGTLLSGIIVWGLIGWGLSAWTGWRGFLAIGVLVGAGLGIYMVVKQADNPPPLMDISKAQDGGLFAERKPERDEDHSTDTAESHDDDQPDEGHTSGGR